MKIYQILLFALIWIAMGVNDAKHHQPGHHQELIDKQCWEDLNASLTKTELESLLLFPNGNIRLWKKENFVTEMQEILSKNEGLIGNGSEYSMRTKKPRCRKTFSKYYNQTFEKYLDFLSDDELKVLKVAINDGFERGFMMTMGFDISNFVRDNNMTQLEVGSIRIGKLCDIFYRTVLEPTAYERFKLAQNLSYFRAAYEFLENYKVTPLEFEENVEMAIKFCQKMAEFYTAEPNKEHNKEMMLSALQRRLEPFNETSILLNSNASYMDEYLGRLSEYLTSNDGIEKKEVASTILNFCKKSLFRRLRRTELSVLSGNKLGLGKLGNFTVCNNNVSRLDFFDAFGKTHSNTIRLIKPVCELSLKIQCNLPVSHQFDTRRDPNVLYFIHLSTRIARQQTFDDNKFEMISRKRPSHYFSNFAKSSHD